MLLPPTKDVIDYGLDADDVLRKLSDRGFVVGGSRGISNEAAKRLESSGASSKYHRGGFYNGTAGLSEYFVDKEKYPDFASPVFKSEIEKTITDDVSRLP